VLSTVWLPTNPAPPVCGGLGGAGVISGRGVGVGPPPVVAAATTNVAVALVARLHADGHGVAARGGRCRNDERCLERAETRDHVRHSGVASIPGQLNGAAPEIGATHDGGGSRAAGRRQEGQRGRGAGVGGARGVARGEREQPDEGDGEDAQRGRDRDGHRLEAATGAPNRVPRGLRRERVRAASPRRAACWHALRPPRPYVGAR
jgi:hypothetical protein